MPRKRVLAGADEARKWWRSRVAVYESHFFASAVSDLNPSTIEVSAKIRGRFFSAVFDTGIRHYCFEFREDRDRFTTKFGKVFSARPVGKDPCP